LNENSKLPATSSTLAEIRVIPPWVFDANHDKDKNPEADPVLTSCTGQFMPQSLIMLTF